MRLVGFVGVIALIVGTSVSLASADDRSPAPRAKATRVAATADVATSTPVASEPAPTLREASTPDAAPVEVDADAAPVDAKAAPAPEPEPTAVSVEPDAVSATASGTVPDAALPLTGDAQVRWIMLGGALLVLMGMLVQVAGQPLPARRASH